MSSTSWRRITGRSKEWFDEYDELKEDDDRKAELAQKICLALHRCRIPEGVTSS